MNGWRKSSHSFSNGNCAEVAACKAGNCAEAGQDGTVVLVRDTQDRGGPVLAFGGVAWGGVPGAGPAGPGRLAAQIAAPIARRARKVTSC